MTKLANKHAILHYYDNLIAYEHEKGAKLGKNALSGQKKEYVWHA